MAEADFKAALSFVQNSKDAKLSNDVKLAFYGLYKIITDGPCKTPAPSRLKMIERAKWQAWSNLGSLSKEAAMKRYVEALTKAVPTWKNNLPSKL